MASLCASSGCSGSISWRLDTSEDQEQDPAPGNHISCFSLALLGSRCRLWPPTLASSPRGTLTQADGGLACPAAVSFAGAVLGAALEGEALLAGIDERVAHGGQVQGPDVGVGWRLWLLAVVGWTRRKTSLDRGRLGSSGRLPTISPFLDGTAPSFPSWAPFMSGPSPPHTPMLTSM